MQEENVGMDTLKTELRKDIIQRCLGSFARSNDMCVGLGSEENACAAVDKLYLDRH